MQIPEVLELEWELAKNRIAHITEKNISAIGIPELPNDCSAAGLFGFDCIKKVEGKHFIPFEDGEPAWIIPSISGRGPHFPGDQHCLIVDLIATKTHTPHTWQTRFGAAPLLGIDWPDWCKQSIGISEQLFAYSTPLDWLRSGGQGVCVLDWDADLSLCLGGVEQIVCDNMKLAQQLACVFNDQPKRPRLLVSEEASNVA